VALCLGAETGKEHWRFPLGETLVSKDGSGPRSTPTIDGDRVYALGSRGGLYCLRLGDGKKLWDADLKARFDAPLPAWGFACSPLVDGELLLLSAGGRGGQSVVALDKMTGKTKWTALDDPAGYSSPVISKAAGTRQVVFFTGSAVAGLDPEKGDVFWRFPWETTQAANVATPIVRGDYVFISSGYNQGCALLRVVKNGDGSLAVKRVYRNNLMRNHFSTSVFTRATCTASTRAAWSAWTSAATRARGSGGRGRSGSSNRGSLLLAGDRLIVLGESGNVALVEPTPEEYREKASFRLTERKCWTLPALAQGRLYVRDEQELYCIDLRKK